MTVEQTFSYIHLATFSLAVLILIWGRFRYFKIESQEAKVASKLYDLPVAIHILTSIYWLADSTEKSIANSIVGILLSTFGICLFVWSIRFASQMQFALTKKIEAIVKSGPYKLVRHPLYISYSFVWCSTTLVFNSILLWITLTYLMAFYVSSAKREQEAILKSEHSREYELYKNEVGMFFPRISQWKSWYLELLQIMKKKKSY